MTLYVYWPLLPVTAVAMLTGRFTRLELEFGDPADGIATGDYVFSLIWSTGITMAKKKTYFLFENHEHLKWLPKLNKSRPSRSRFQWHEHNSIPLVCQKKLFHHLTMSPFSVCLSAVSHSTKQSLTDWQRISVLVTLTADASLSHNHCLSIYLSRYICLCLSVCLSIWISLWVSMSQS